MGRAVEDHVLQKMGQSLLRVGFMNRTRLDHQMHAHSVFGGVALHEHVAEAVCKLAEHQVRIGLQIAGVMGPGGRVATGGGHIPGRWLSGRVEGAAGNQEERKYP